VHKCTEFAEPELVVLSLVDLTTHFEPSFGAFLEVCSSFIELGGPGGSELLFSRGFEGSRGSEPCFLDV